MRGSPADCSLSAVPAQDRPAWQVYILECADQTLYTGIARDALARLAVHNSGRGARYTRSRLPVRLVYLEAAADRSTALRREAAIRRLGAAGKRALAGTWMRGG